MTDTLSLHRKLAQIMYEADRIPKNGTAPREMGGYPFVQVGDAADYIRKALAEKVITMMPTAVHVVGQTDRPTKSGGNMTTVDLITEWTLTDGESGESITIMSFGAGADGGDKYSGKASTSAMKYALLTGFLLSTGEDSEASKLPEQRSERNPRVGAEDYEPPRNDGGLIGTAAIGEAPADFQIRMEEGGEALSFKLMDGRKGFRVVARGQLAIALSMVKSGVIGQRVTCWGTMGTDTFTKGGRKITYNIFNLERIQAPDFILPSTDHPISDAAEDSSIEAEPARAERPQPGPLDPPGTSEAVVADTAAASVPLVTVPDFGQQYASMGGYDEPPVTVSVPVPDDLGVDEPKLCLNKGSLDTICGLLKGHAGKHRELATDGRTLAQW